MKNFKKSVLMNLIRQGLTLTPSGIVILAESTVSSPSGIEMRHEQAVGNVNGINKIFLSSQPFECVYINGLIQIESVHYTKTGSTTFELSDAPLPGDTVSVTYIQ